LTQIAQILAAQNMDISAGSVDEGAKSYLVRTTGQFKDLEDIRNAVVAYKGGVSAMGAPSPLKTVRLRDVATVEESYRAANSVVFINGEPGIYISIQKQSGTNSVEVADNVKDRLVSINRNLPSGVGVETLTDSTQMIRDSLSQVTNSAVTGAVLAMLVLFVFLRSLKSTFIVGLSIPISLLITLMVMYFSGLTLNIMTLGGLTLGIGMIVDSSIVILENIFRYREKGAKLKPSAILGSSEMVTAIFASTLTTVCVFLPVLMFKKELEVIGVMFKDIALTVVIALLSSLAVSVSLVPVLSSAYLRLYTRKQRPLKNRFLGRIDTGMDRFFTALDNGYKKTLAFVLNFRAWTVVIIAAVLILSITMIPSIGFNLFPVPEDESVTLEVELPIGSNLGATEEVMDRLEEIINREVNGIKDIIVTSGTSVMFGLGGNAANMGQIKITLPPFEERLDTSGAIQEKLRAHFDDFPAVIFNFTAGQANMSGGAPINIAIRSEDLVKAKAMGEKIETLIRDNLTDVTEPELSISDGLPQVEVVIDRNKAYDLGLNVYSIGQEVSANVDGKTATRFRSGGSEYDVVVILPEEDRNEIPDLKKIFVVNSMGKRIPLSSFASLEKSTGPVSITREDQVRTVHVTAGLRPGVPTNVGESQVRELIKANIITDEDVVIDYAGDYAEIMKMVRKFIVIMIIAVALVFGVMASQFESLKDPFIIFLSIPLMVIGIVFLYALMGTPFSMLTAVGLVMLAGIVVNNGIVLVDYTNLLRKRGLPVREACIEAGGNRLRPILMTTLTTVLGMVPMAFLRGEGAEMVRPIGLTVVGGLSVSTIMTLFMVPVVYSLFNKETPHKEKQV
jgi:hydrophobic/amphiphilic exporter-1 (mainly G- bacteria), HAE1 family